jgi:hypothetical protein
VVDRDARQPGEPRLELGQVARVEVQLGVPARQVPDAARERLEAVEPGAPAAVEVEPHRADAGLVQRQDLGVADAGGQLGHAGERRAEGVERGAQPALVEALERAGHDRAARHVEVRGPRAVVGDRERLGGEAVAVDEREARVDDVQVRVEERRHRERTRWRAAFVRLPQMRMEHHWLERLRERS